MSLSLPFCLAAKSINLRPTVRPINHNDERLDHSDLRPKRNTQTALFNKLCQLSHPSLCKYVDIVFGRQGRVFLISEHHSNTLREKFSRDPTSTSGWQDWESALRPALWSIINALDYLVSRGVVHRNLSPDTIVVDANGCVKLSDFGLYLFTDFGRSVNFPIGAVNYMAPETLIATADSTSTPKVDIWALGITIVELIIGESLAPMKGSFELPKVLKSVIEISTLQDDPQTPRLSYLMRSGQWKRISADLCSLINDCLTVQVDQRPDINQLRNHRYFADFQAIHQTKYIWVPKPLMRSVYLSDDPDEELSNPSIARQLKPIIASIQPPPSQFTPEEIYNYWRLNGGDVESYVTSYLQIPPPITRVPRIVRSSTPIADGVYKNQNDRSLLHNDQLILLPIKSIVNLLGTNESKKSISEIFGAEWSPSKLPPLEIREKSVEYQRQRISLFRSMLEKMPASKRAIIHEAKIDIPPLLRPLIWAIALEVGDDAQQIYDCIDHDCVTAADHQIDLDVPRCHQYHPLLSSADGHTKLRSILRAWIIHNSDMVYWQGIDSLLAPFLTINFDNDARCFCCLNELIQRLLNNFFKRNSITLQGHLLIFRQLLAYHDPELATHLYRIGFHPELYAVSWFLTLFTHVFPMESIYRLWDSLLLSPPSIPLFFAVSLMKQLRSSLLALDFNSCILFFSRLPQLDIESALVDANLLFEKTPMSIVIQKQSSLTCDHAEGGWSLEKLRQELAPRISLNDLRAFKQPMMMVDIRTPEEFIKLRYSDSINLDLHNTTLKDLETMKGRHIVIIDSDTSNAAKLASKLVAARLPFVSVLHEGIQPLLSGD